MKIHGLFLCLLFMAVTVFGQSQTNRLAEIKNQIDKIESQIKEKEAKIVDLQARYTDEYQPIKQLKSEIVVLSLMLVPLKDEQLRMLVLEGNAPLPNNQIELLKILIIQNEKIINLLQKLQPPENKKGLSKQKL